MEVLVEPLAPDWRTLGGGSSTSPTTGTAPAPQPAAHRTIIITPRVLTWLIGGLLAAALTGGAAFLALVPATGSVVIDAGTSDAGAMAISPDATGPVSAPVRAVLPSLDLVVDVEGAVAHPGLVHVPTGGRVGDALTRAGGFAANADLTRTATDLNLAQPVTDGLKVVVPAIGQASVHNAPADPGATGAGTTATSGPLDLNRATEAELDTLPGVGPATIAKIVAARQSAPFSSTEDLRTRRVVGDAAFEKLKGLVTVGR
jgi:competence protein ComEA